MFIRHTPSIPSGIDGGFTAVFLFPFLSERGATPKTLPGYEMIAATPPWYGEYVFMQEVLMTTKNWQKYLFRALVVKLPNYN